MHTRGERQISIFMTRMVDLLLQSDRTTCHLHCLVEGSSCCLESYPYNGQTKVHGSSATPSPSSARSQRMRPSYSVRTSPSGRHAPDQASSPRSPLPKRICQVWDENVGLKRRGGFISQGHGRHVGHGSVVVAAVVVQANDAAANLGNNILASRSFLLHPLVPIWKFSARQPRVPFPFFPRGPKSHVDLQNHERKGNRVCPSSKVEGENSSPVLV